MNLMQLHTVWLFIIRANPTSLVIIAAIGTDRYTKSAITLHIKLSARIEKTKFSRVADLLSSNILAKSWVLASDNSRDFFSISISWISSDPLFFSIIVGIIVIVFTLICVHFL